MADSKDEDVEGLTILEALAQLKEDIYKLQESNAEKNREPLFRITDGELELKLVAKKHLSGDGKVKGKWRLYVLGGDAEAGVSAGIEKERLQTLRIRFTGLGSEKAAPRQMHFGTTTGPVPSTTGPVVQAPQTLPMGGSKNPTEGK